MLHNFQLAAIVKQGAEVRLLRIPLHRNLQNRLAQSWYEQYRHFTDNTHEIPFDPGYTPEANEQFCLEDYELPGWLADETSLTTSELAPLTNDEATFDAICGVAAFARLENDEELILFQNSNRSHVIRPGRLLLMERDTYETTANPGLTLDIKLSAVYHAAEQELLFHNFRTVNTFLPLTEFYSEASEEHIREVLAHEKLHAENVDALAVDASQWFRKRFAMLRDSDVLDIYPVDFIQERSANYEVDLRVDNGKIIIPADKTAAKKVLQFLNEELFRGAITETLFETNSKREAD